MDTLHKQARAFIRNLVKQGGIEGPSRSSGSLFGSGASLGSASPPSSGPAGGAMGAKPAFDSTSSAMSRLSAPGGFKMNMGADGIMHVGGRQGGGPAHPNPYSGGGHVTPDAVLRGHAGRSSGMGGGSMSRGSLGGGMGGAAGAGAGAGASSAKPVIPPPPKPAGPSVGAQGSPAGGSPSGPAGGWGMTFGGVNNQFGRGSSMIGTGQAAGQTNSMQPGTTAPRNPRVNMGFGQGSSPSMQPHTVDSLLNNTTRSKGFQTPGADAAAGEAFPVSRDRIQRSTGEQSLLPSARSAQPMIGPGRDGLGPLADKGPSPSPAAGGGGLADQIRSRESQLQAGRTIDAARAQPAAKPDLATSIRQRESQLQAGRTIDAARQPTNWSTPGPAGKMRAETMARGDQATGREPGIMDDMNASLGHLVGSRSRPMGALGLMGL